MGVALGYMAASGSSHEGYQVLLTESTMDTSSSISSSSMKWSLCIFCQKSRDEILTCPAESKQQNAGVGYSTLADDLKHFQEIGGLPNSFKLSRLDEGNGVYTTLANHKTKWHKACRDKYNKTKLVRLEKRRISLDSSESTNSASKRSRSRSATTMSECICFFCDEPAKAGELRHVSTFGLDCRVRSAALKVGDTKLLATLSAGDVVAIEMKYHLKYLTSLYNHAKVVESQETLKCQQDNMIHSVAFAELVV